MSRGTGARLIEVSEIASMLNGRIDGVIAALKLDGRAERGDFVAYNPRRMDANLGSFRICTRGAKQGVWKDFALGAEAAGDTLDLVAYIKNIAKCDAIEWAKEFLGLGDADPEALKRARRKVRTQVAGRQKSASAQAIKYRNIAFRDFIAARERLRGTMAERYFAGRGIDLGRLSRQPRALRYHPCLWNSESQKKLPALVAAITGGDGTFVALHRIWLAEQPGGAVIKAALKDNKMTLGAYAPSGGAIRLWRGSSGVALKDAAAGSGVVICEGIEDALTIAIAAPERRILCSVAVANMANIALPAAVTEVVIYPDDDGDNGAAGAALDHAIKVFRAQGREVKLARRIPGFKDANAVAQAQVNAVKIGAAGQ